MPRAPRDAQSSDVDSEDIPKSLMTQPDASTSAAAGDKQVRNEAKKDDDGPITMKSVLDALIGPELASVVTGTFSEDELTKIGQKEVDRAVRSFEKEAKSSEQSPVTTQTSTSKASTSKSSTQASTTTGATEATTVEQQMAGQAVKAISADLKTEAAELLKTDKGQQLVSAISSRFDGSPDAIISSILLASAYVAMNDLKIPALQHTFGSGVSFTGDVDYGSFKHLALQSLGAKLSFTRGDVKSSVKISELHNEAAEKLLGGGATSGAHTGAKSKKSHKAKLVSGNVGSAETVKQLEEEVAWQVSQQLALKATSTDDFAEGHVIRGKLGLSSTYKLDNGDEVKASVNETYGSMGKRNGLGATASFTMHVTSDVDVVVQGTLNADHSYVATVGFALKIP